MQHFFDIKQLLYTSAYLTRAMGWAAGVQFPARAELFSTPQHPELV
jgi:hypothetical protein